MSKITFLERLQEQFLRAHRIDHASTFLSWDQMVMMPAGGVQARGESLAELASMHHELLTAPQLSDWFEGATAELEAMDQPSDWQRANLSEMRRSWLQATAVPAELVKAQVLAGTRCEHGWRTQRTQNDWAGFLVNFKEVLALSREEARCRQSASDIPLKTPYDALLDLHCRGDDQALIESVFAQLKTELPDILQKTMAVQKGLDSSLAGGPYPIDDQKALSEKLMQTLGFDFAQGRLDVSAHPFSSGVRGDQRITTRFRESEFLDALQATAHETGHASYEGGLPAQWSGLPVGRSRNMCIHESQSLLFEKQIFGSRAFMQFFATQIRETLPKASAIEADALCARLNRVEPSYIRVEADEVTYPLHVMLRYDIESALINGQIEAANIPELWNQHMQDYLGLSTADDHGKGCLQDIHWTDGAFGYFPSYTMGAVNSAQLFATLKAEHGDWQAQLAEGDVGFIRDWLSANIWQRASLYDSQELMKQATGQGSNPEFLLAHLKARYVEQLY